MNSQKDSINCLIEAGRRKAKDVLRPIYRPIKRVARFVIWAFPALVNLLSLRTAKGRRILAVYDTSSQPFSIGDLLIFQEASLVLCQLHQVDVVDMVVVYDADSPASSDPVFAASITGGNIFYHLASILPVAQVNQNLGSLFVFNSYEQLERYITDNSERYYVWPSGWKFSSREYLSPVIFNDLLFNHYKAHGAIPHLTCRPFLRNWAEGFYRDNVRPLVPVTINVRNNKAFHLHRNSQMDCWIDLFRHCETRYAVKFVVICARSEIDERWAACPNVIVAKDHHTGVEQDMALINTSAMHMGAGSGPATMAWFNSKPYLMVNTTYKEGEFFERPGMIRQEERHIQSFWFAGPFQRVANGTETAELLIKEFERMWETIDKKLWQSATDTRGGSDAGLGGWLR